MRSGWLTRKRTRPKPPDGASQAQEAQTVFLEQSCVNCHRVRGVAAKGTYAPDLTHLMSRQTLASGMIPNTPENLRKWVDDPQQIKPGCLMPAFGLSERNEDLVVHYLETLKLRPLVEPGTGYGRCRTPTRAAHRAGPPGRGRPLLHEWVTTVDHKKIGILYILMAVVLPGRRRLRGAGDALAAVLARATTSSRPDAFNQMFTMHGTTMVFFVGMPILIGMGNYIVPLQIGARDMAFPRLNALGFWVTLFGGLLVYFSFATGGAPAIGWFAYAPLTEHTFSRGPATDFWALGLLVSGVGSIAAAVNFVATILAMRAPA